jgi:DsbC/DsbD-like thiol-disulfide interchange protein
MNLHWDRFVFARVFLLSAALFSSCADAAERSASDWANALKSRARLVADGAGGAAIEIELASNAITYWRDPGEAGVPPTFDFSDSENAANIKTIFPAPSRIQESDGSVAFGYRDKAVFPLEVTPIDSSRPTILKLKASYAVCEKICLPAHATLALTVTRDASTPYAAEILDARAHAPKPVAPADIGAEVTALERRAWRLCFAGQAAPQRDLFVEPPSGFWLTAAPAPSGNCFELALREIPPGGALPIPVTATLVEGARAFETTVTLTEKK